MDDRSACVSVIIPFLDAERYIQEAIESVYAQTHRRWELLLIDDGSTDASTSIAKSHAERRPDRVRYLAHEHHQNRGTSISRNVGIDQATGEFIAFLDADDVFLPQRLERGVTLLQQHTNATMAYGQTEYWYDWLGSASHLPNRIQPHGIPANRVVPGRDLLTAYLTERAAIPCPTSIIVRRQSSAARFIDAFTGLYDDQAYLAHFCLHNDVFVSDEYWDRYRQHPQSLCATSTGGRNIAERARYLRWLRQLLLTEAVRDPGVWHALRYAERSMNYHRAGRYNRLIRTALRLTARTRISLARAARSP
jgi:glycosyltransferase involved in cell wall biosynthesis